MKHKQINAIMDYGARFHKIMSIDLKIYSTILSRTMRISLQKRIRRQTQHMKSKAFFPLFGEDLRLVSVCPLCKAKKEAIKTQVVDENEEAHLLHMQCGECGSAVVAVVVHASSGLNSVGMLTDLTYDDVLKFRAAAPIEIDNILAFYEALKNQEKFLEHIA